MTNIDYGFDNFRKKAIIRFLALDKYQYLRNQLYKVDLTKDIDGYQKSFNAFYRVRRSEEWRNAFYAVFEQLKNQKDIEFGAVLKQLYDKTGCIEASFSSKMLATINPEKPIWDRYIIDNFQLKVEKGSVEKRIESIISVYERIEQIEKELLKRRDVQTLIEQFNQVFGEYELSDIKILDYVVWNTRDQQQEVF